MEKKKITFTGYVLVNCLLSISNFQIGQTKKKRGINVFGTSQFSASETPG